MKILAQVSIVIFACGLSFYLYAIYRLYRVVQAEHSEWLKTKSYPLFGDGLMHLGDPNVMAKLFRIIYGRRASQLRAPAAMKYIRRIRTLLPVELLAFAVFMIAVIGGKP